ncbi:hypothetical protein ILUMI_19843, partial [Ignelater luminosus]
SYFPRCYLDDPKLNACVLQAFNEIRPHISNGIEEIGLPSLNPLVIKKLLMLQDTMMANYTLTASNYTIAGLYNYDIKEFQYNLETMTFHFRIEFDTIPITTFIEVNGHVVNIPVVGKGLVRTAYGPIDATFEIEGSMSKFKSIDHYNPKNVKVDLNIGDGSYYLEGFFDNNEQLVRLTNEMLNANSVIVTKALTPLFEELAEIGVMRFMKRLMKIPYYKLFPPSH